MVLEEVEESKLGDDLWEEVPKSRGVEKKGLGWAQALARVGGERRGRFSCVGL